MLGRCILSLLGPATFGGGTRRRILSRTKPDRFGKKVLILVRDATAERDAQEVKERGITQVLQTQKNEVVSQMAAGVAHDFNNC